MNIRLLAFGSGSLRDWGSRGGSDTNRRFPAITLPGMTVEVIFDNPAEDGRGVISALPGILEDHCDSDIGLVRVSGVGITGEPGVRSARTGLGRASLTVNRDIEPVECIESSAERLFCW